jgi:hypothetical protein
MHSIAVHKQQCIRRGAQPNSSQRHSSARPAGAAAAECRCGLRSATLDSDAVRQHDVTPTNRCPCQQKALQNLARCSVACMPCSVLHSLTNSPTDFLQNSTKCLPERGRLLSHSNECLGLFLLAFFRASVLCSQTCARNKRCGECDVVLAHDWVPPRVTRRT